MTDIHFISGMPRAGTTLLASLLRQHPAIESSFASATGYAVVEAMRALGPANESHCMVGRTRRDAALYGIIAAFALGSPLYFDNNRRWTVNWPVLKDIAPSSKMVVCLRPVVEVVESILSVTTGCITPIFRNQTNLTTPDKVNILFEPGGLVSYALEGCRQVRQTTDNRILFINYSDLVDHTVETMHGVNRFIGIEPYPYDVDEIKQMPGAAQFDHAIGVPNLHSLYPTVKRQPAHHVLPDGLRQQLSALGFD